MTNAHPIVLLSGSGPGPWVKALDGVGAESGWADSVVPKPEPGRSSPQRNGAGPSRACSATTIHERERTWLMSIGKLGSSQLPPVGR